MRSPCLKGTEKTKERKLIPELGTHNDGAENCGESDYLHFQGYV